MTSQRCGRSAHAPGLWAPGLTGIPLRNIRSMRSKLLCLIVLVLFMGAGTACGGEGEEQRLPTSPAEEGGEGQEQEGGETEQEDGGGD